MNLGIVFADHINHLCVDDEDDHRILVTRCGMRIGYSHPKNRQSSPHGDHITCFECLTLTEDQDPNLYELQRLARGNGAIRKAAQQPTYRATINICNVPMCGESGVCADCRKRGAR